MSVKERAERLAKRYKKKSELLAQIEEILKVSKELNDVRRRELELSQLMHEKLQRLCATIATEDDEI